MKKFDKNLIFGAGAIIIAALFRSFDGIFLRPHFYNIPIGLLIFLEHILGFILLSPFIITGWWKIKTLSWKSWFAILRICIFGGLIGTFMITQAFFLAFAGTITFATVILLQKLQPVFALLMAKFILKERLKPSFYFWAIVAITAGYLLAFGDIGLNFSQIDWFNNAAVFSVFAAFAFGSSTVFGKRIVNHLDFKITAGLRFGITGILALILILITRDFGVIGTIQIIQRKYLSIIVITSGAGALFLYYFGLKKVKASTATILELFRPLSAVALDYIFNKNTLTRLQITAALILLGAFYMIIKTQKNSKLQFISKVIPGYGKGKTLGFHTANLKNTDIDIPHGVYICTVLFKNKNYRGLMHFGFRETFQKEASLEIYIKDFSQDIYEQKLSISVEKKIRNIKKFTNTQALQQQIKKDVREIV